MPFDHTDYKPYSEDELKVFLDSVELWEPEHRARVGRLIATLREAKQFGDRMDSIRRSLLESEAESDAKFAREYSRVERLIEAARTDPKLHGVGLDRETRRAVAFQRVEKVIDEIVHG